MTVTSLHDRRHRTAWVLGGGGNLGSIQVGMLRALIDRGERPDLVLGCSVGSLNGLAMAADPSPDGVEALREIWLDIDGEEIFPSGRISGPWQLLKRAPSLYGNEGLQALIERCSPHDRIEDFPIPFQCVATDLHTGRARWFDSGPVVDAVLASTALPAAFPPVEIGSDLYIDGAVVDNVPFTRALHLGFDRVVVLHVGNFERPRPTPRRPLDVLLQSFSISRNARFEADMSRVPDDVELVVLPGIDPGAVRRNDFTRSSELIERAHASTAAYLDLRAKVAGGAS